MPAAIAGLSEACKAAGGLRRWAWQGLVTRFWALAMRVWGPSVPSSGPRCIGLPPQRPRPPHRLVALLFYGPQPEPSTPGERFTDWLLGLVERVLARMGYFPNLRAGLTPKEQEAHKAQLLRRSAYDAQSRKVHSMMVWRVWHVILYPYGSYRKYVGAKYHNDSPLEFPSARFRSRGHLEYSEWAATKPGLIKQRQALARRWWGAWAEPHDKHGFPLEPRRPVLCRTTLDGLDCVFPHTIFPGTGSANLGRAQKWASEVATRAGVESWAALARSTYKACFSAAEGLVGRICGSPLAQAFASNKHLLDPAIEFLNKAIFAVCDPAGPLNPCGPRPGLG